MLFGCCGCFRGHVCCCCCCIIVSILLPIFIKIHTINQANEHQLSINSTNNSNSKSGTTTNNNNNNKQSNNSNSKSSDYSNTANNQTNINNNSEMDVSSPFAADIKQITVQQKPLGGKVIQLTLSFLSLSLFPLLFLSYCFRNLIIFD